MRSWTCGNSPAWRRSSSASPPSTAGRHGSSRGRCAAEFMTFKNRLTARWRVPILNCMVKYQDTALDRTFAALSDSTRRALLARLNDNDGLSVSELAQPFSMSLPAVMKHLDVLSDAGLVTRSKTGRTVSCALKAAPMEDAMQWLNRYQRF